MTSKQRPTAQPADDLPEDSIRPAGRKADRPAELPDADPPEKLSALAGEYVGLSIAGGLVVGLLIGAMFPRKAAKKAARTVSGRTSRLAAAAGEVGLAVATKALSRAGSAIREGREKAIDMGELVSESVAEHAAPVIASATRLLGEGAGKARDASATVAEKTANMIAKARSHS